MTWHTFHKLVMHKMWCRDMLEELMDDEDEMRDMNLSSRPGREEKRRVRERDRLEREMERRVCPLHSCIACAFAVLHCQACLLHYALRKGNALYNQLLYRKHGHGKCWGRGCWKTELMFVLQCDSPHVAAEREFEIGP